MEIPPALLQFLGSLAAIMVLAAIAWKLGLGPRRTFGSESEARDAAHEALDGFSAVEVALDREGEAALLRDSGGQVMVLRGHGTHFAGRLLSPRAKAWRDGEVLVIDTAEKRFGTVRLTVEDASAWAGHIDAVGRSVDA